MALFSTHSSASLFTGKIVKILVGPAQGDKVYLHVDSEPDDRPACFLGTYQTGANYVLMAQQVPVNKP